MSSRQPQRGNARSHGRGQREPQQQHKRSRGGSAPCCDAAAVSGACEGSVIVKSTPPALPGLVWDEAKQRYFRLPPSHSHFYAIAAGAAQSTTAVEDTQALQIPGAATGKQLQSSSMSLCSSVRSACLHPHAHTSSQLLPMMRECIAGVGRANYRQARLVGRWKNVKLSRAANMQHIPAAVLCCSVTTVCLFWNSPPT